MYGDGLQIRDWLHVEDHCTGIWTAMEKGVPGEVYNVRRPASRDEPRDHAAASWNSPGCDPALVRHVTDRPGHDRRYALDTSKSQALGWAPRHDFVDGLAATVAWYRDRREWWEPIKSGAYRTYYEEQYGSR